MAYDYFPKTRVEIAKELSDFPATNIQEIENLFSFLKRRAETPINIDKKKPGIINVARSISDDLSIAEIKRGAGLTKIKIKFGNGSSGNRGVNNRGNLFEPQFAEALMKWWAGEQVTDDAMLGAIKDIDKTYDMSNSETFKVDVVGGLNTARPLYFRGGKPLITNPKGQGFDIGTSVTDITITLDNNKEIYLSLKLGGTTTFFNVGVKKILSKNDIENYNITGDGLSLLKTFGVDPERFCNIFNQSGGGGKARGSNYDKTALSGLLKTGIGSGYHVIHKMGRTIKSFEINNAYLNQASSVIGVPTINYGGKTGRGRRVDIDFSTSKYNFSLNLRDTQGKDGYPSRLMCDFKYR